MNPPGVLWVAAVWFLAWFWPTEATTWSGSFRIGPWFFYWTLTYWGTPVIWNPKPGVRWLGRLPAVERWVGVQGANRWATWYFSVSKPIRRIC